MEEAIWQLRTLRENPETHSPFRCWWCFTVKSLGRGFVFCCQLLLQNFMMFINPLPESCWAEGTQGNKSQCLAWVLPTVTYSSPPFPAKQHWLLSAKNTTHHDPKQSTPASKTVKAEVMLFEITESWQPWFYYWPCYNLGNIHYSPSVLVSLSQHFSYYQLQEITELVKVFAGKLENGIPSTNPRWTRYVEMCACNFNAGGAEMGGSCGSVDTLYSLIGESHTNDRHVSLKNSNWGTTTMVSFGPYTYL